jgi:hypothetical protein
MEKRFIIVVAGLALVLGGCRDLGLPGNIPEEEARVQAPPDLVRDVMPRTGEPPVRLVVDGRLWVPTGRPSPHTPGALRPVGSAAGQTVYARSWDERPYRAIFTAVEMPALELAATPREAMEAGREHWQEYAPVIGQTGSVPAADRFRQDRPREAPPASGDAPPTPRD